MLWLRLPSAQGGPRREDSMDTQALLAAHPSAWQGATRHPFLDGVRDGSLPMAAFNNWLVQDYHYVHALLRWQSGVLARAPRADQLVVAQGLVGLAAELDWFEALAVERGLNLVEPLLAANEAYGQMLARLAQEPYAAEIVALWAVEQAYHDAWRSARPGAASYRALIRHWTTRSFAAYVSGLAAAADRALAGATPEEALKAAEAFTAVALHERAFWGMVTPERGRRGELELLPYTGTGGRRGVRPAAPALGDER